MPPVAGLPPDAGELHRVFTDGTVDGPEHLQGPPMEDLLDYHIGGVYVLNPAQGDTALPAAGVLSTQRFVLMGHGNPVGEGAARAPRLLVRPIEPPDAPGVELSPLQVVMVSPAITGLTTIGGLVLYSKDRRGRSRDQVADAFDCDFVYTVRSLILKFNVTQGATVPLVPQMAPYIQARMDEWWQADQALFQPSASGVVPTAEAWFPHYVAYLATPIVVPATFDCARAFDAASARWPAATE